MTRRELGEGWIDITRNVEVGMPCWPGDPPVELERVVDMDKGEDCNVSKLTICTHSGTHIDAPVHFIRGAEGADGAPLAVLMGMARVIEITDRQCIRREELLKHGIEIGERLLFKTANSGVPWGGPFRSDFVYLDAGAAKYLAEKQTLLVGIDGMSVGGFTHDMVETHVELLNAGVWILENLNLEHIESGKYEMVCLPMKLTGADGAPARVILRAV